jgi:hypothetical protein
MLREVERNSFSLLGYKSSFAVHANVFHANFKRQECISIAYR